MGGFTSRVESVGTRASRIDAQSMGHKARFCDGMHYQSRPLDHLLRKWHAKIEAWILVEAGIPQPKERAGHLQVVK